MGEEGGEGDGGGGESLGSAGSVSCWGGVG